MSNPKAGLLGKVLGQMNQLADQGFPLQALKKLDEAMRLLDEVRTDSGLAPMSKTVAQSIRQCIEESIAQRVRDAKHTA